MKFKENFLYNYLVEAPTSLAIERSLECEILSKQEFARPILDLGCGEGMFAYLLFDEKIDVGIDPNRRELARAKEYGMYHELLQCYGDNIPKEANSFNTILSNSVLEHIPNLKPVLREASRLLSDDGKFYLTVPTHLFDQYTIGYQFLSLFKLRGLAEKYRVFFNKFWSHYNYYTKDKWEELFKECGFKVVAYQEYDSRAICTLNDFLAPFAFLGFLIKKLFNRWVLFKKVRGVYIFPVYLLVKYLMKRCEKGKPGGIIFFTLSKRG
ncbi:class I SAM-dependent methyltransferase [candidate division KSB1 bacterium]|nr:class I SAM-dependent methyltransferase [candidate division KSB1 bacterium]